MLSWFGFKIYSETELCSLMAINKFFFFFFLISTLAELFITRSKVPYLSANSKVRTRVYSGPASFFTSALFFLLEKTIRFIPTNPVWV